jgi:hypothetical protein
MKKGTLRIETRPTIPPVPIGLWVIVDGIAEIMLDPEQARLTIEQWGKLQAPHVTTPEGGG